MIRIRSCRGFDEFEVCVKMQIETWGYDQSDVIPRKAFLVAQRIGGQILGAFDTDLPGAGPGVADEGGAGDDGGPESMIGFAMSLPGVKTGSGDPVPYLHSHMLAVREGYRNRGLGAQLKLEQRREALSRGIRLIEWTFDPLEIRNAHLNIHKLGAISRCYLTDFYGVSSSRLQGGLPTDRLVAEWRLGSERVTAPLEGRPRPAYRIEERIPVPAAIYEWKTSDKGRERALVLQAENRERLQKAFSRELAVVGYARDAEGNGCFELGALTQAELP